MSKLQSPKATAPLPLSEQVGNRPWFIALVVLLLAGAIAVTYSNSLNVPFHLDDSDSIHKNVSIRKFSTALFPPSDSGITVSGRPLLNLTLALNYHLHGTQVTGYHLGNILIHIGAALALFGVIRRTLRLPSLSTSFAAQNATLLAGGAAALWALHPLQTESVTYVIQRAESLVGLCYLFTVYSFVRSVEKPSRFWNVITVVSCFLGMAAKEVMATAPLILFLYDRTFVAGSFAASWRARKSLYWWLASSWMLLLVLVISSGGRGTSVGYSAVSATDYALTQASALVRYLKVTILPTDLIFDYGPTVEKIPSVLIRSTLIIFPFIAGTVIALRKWPVAGFLGAVFFVILGPTTSVVPVATQTIAEHRLYLSVAAAAVGVSLTLWRLAGKHAIWIVMTLALALGYGSYRRNIVYQTPRSLWEDTVLKMPDNIRALNNLGVFYLEKDEFDGAIQCLEGALELVPNFIIAKSNLGRAYILKALKETGLDKIHGDILLGATMGAGLKELNSLQNHPAIQKGLGYLKESIAADPGNALYAMYYGNALILLQRADERLQQSRATEALSWLEKAAKLDPESRDIRFELANAYSMLDRNEEACVHFEKALQLSPNDPTTLTNYGALLRRMGRLPESIAKLEAALQIAPKTARIYSNLGVALLESGRTTEGIKNLDEALKLDPNIPQARYNISNALAETGQTEAAITHLEALLKLAPPTAELISNLGVLYARVGRLPDAITQMREALTLDPHYEPAQENLDKILAYLSAHQKD